MALSPDHVEQILPQAATSNGDVIINHNRPPTKSADVTVNVHTLPKGIYISINGQISNWRNIPKNENLAIIEEREIAK